ncbi:hypothetical protein [Xanthomonas oryzae]|uniref:hypothetical protein n=1 Tax=Xanthomonas oryzae TaxID=347 RepID=UPI000CA045B4|nr:hypothetical protein [Xanthomonas oryzae]PNR67917.1 hypothetical protein LA20_15355 [Xanthomonas oryzae pv. oryzae]PNR73367.1 hypothetical protein LA21_16135 [Xanthomonas oryzae pv. oryzae]PNR75086.1 hypothetical protein LA22_15080 [Xanthomonas oryzae pv. oryzae]PNR84038.1 hypothetical protein LA09_18735 [Xanthomonas oryzae pv. oryzae]RBA64441.1 hypothetical protein BRO09_23120 [Xanthomonas oryzae pv. oryzae]
MIVIDHAPADWFLLYEGDRCWLDINGSISATGVSILLLNASERALVQADPHAACATSASQVQARPHDYAARAGSAVDGKRVRAAVRQWRARGSTAAG